MLALDDDTAGVPPALRARSAARRRLRARSSATGRCGSPPSPTRRCRAMCGQLIEAGRAAAIERSILRQLGVAVATRDALARLSPADLRRHGLATSRASTLVRLVRSLDLERLRDHDTDVVLAAARPRARHRPLVGRGDRARRARALRPRPRRRPRAREAPGLPAGTRVEAGETAELLAPYGEWQGLAGQMLMLGWSRGLIPGADPDVGRRTRLRTKRAA